MAQPDFEDYLLDYRPLDRPFGKPIPNLLDSDKFVYYAALVAIILVFPGFHAVVLILMEFPLNKYEPKFLLKRGNILAR